MSVDTATVRRVARLARIAVTDAEAEAMRTELNAILGFVEQLSEVDVSGVEPMTSVIPMEMKKRQDVVDDGGKADDIVANAPVRDEHFFMVPRWSSRWRARFRSPRKRRFRTTSGRSSPSWTRRSGRWNPRRRTTSTSR